MTFIEFLQYVGSEWGIAAVFAIIMVVLYRSAVARMAVDRRTSEELLKSECNRAEDRLRNDRKYMEDKLIVVLEDYKQAITEGNKITGEHTATLRELLAWLRGQNGRKRES
jgi:hypothetical protein